ncbi:tRNA 5-hydroxyuridine modification protein YegQ [Thiobacter aerophilum]|uniref:tRNA 5-hydroxyuridine modification protein YegQ n=1 Tax=Thiobacter aerophilum TaxID=3121275 RepID=A0ABV0EHR6_9BURK
MPPSPELLSPAGSLEKMRYAFAYGADAVYAGQPRYSLRVRNNEFDLDQLAAGIKEAHRLGKKFYVASNLMPHNAKVKTYAADMAPVIAMGPDALIMADPGLIMLVREKWPDMPIHLSVQANTVNYAAVRFWQRLGLKRVILSRELSLDEIAEIRQRCPDMELEVFVHGALCIAYSGRCLLSGYFNHRDPNQGTCTNACRWDYKVHAAAETDSGDWQKIDFDYSSAFQAPAFAQCGGQPRHPLADQVYLVEEGERPGELMPILEDEHGTYILNSRDLRAIEHVARLVEIGVDALKIEGRTKSVYYVARTAQAYRRAIDDAHAGRPFDPSLLASLEGLANRGYTDGFYQRHHSAEYQNYLRGHSQSGRSQYVGRVATQDAAGWAEIEVKNRFTLGDWLELLTPAGNHRLLLTHMEDLDGAPLEVAPGSGHRVRIPLPVPAPMGLVARMLA